MDIVRRHCGLALHAAAYQNSRKLHDLLVSFQRRCVDQSAARGIRAAAQRCAGQCGVKPDWVSADAAIEWAACDHCSIVTMRDADYPPLLAHLHDAPPILFVRGDPGVLSHPQIALVGSRKASATGCEISAQLARELTQSGLLVTSGLAYGIDAAAHRGALSADGRTIAVLGSGVDRIYPRPHEQLAAEITRAGALVSEFPLGSPPRAHHFPRRNRIISGLTGGTVVVEAVASSGSIITAMQALDQGREVFAVPGSIRDPRSRGCHALIKQGAKLVESAADILDEIGPRMSNAPRSKAESVAVRDSCKGSDIGERETRLLNQCGYEPTSIDTLVVRSGLTANEVSSMLLALELKGHIASCSGVSFVRKEPK